MQNIIDHIAEILILTFLCITFLQSGIDKILDWKGNLGFIKEHFSKTFLKNMVAPMLITILIFEVVAGVLTGVGIFEFISNGVSEYALAGAVFSSIVLLMLLFGQRIAKDYAGALTITCYFIVAIFGVYLLKA